MKIFFKAAKINPFRKRGVKNYFQGDCLNFKIHAKVKADYTHTHTRVRSVPKMDQFTSTNLCASRFHERDSIS